MAEDGNNLPDLQDSTLFGQLLQELDDHLEPSHLKEVLYLIHDKVGKDVKSLQDVKDTDLPSSILRPLLNYMTEQDTFAVLKYAFYVMNLHIEEGTKLCGDMIAEYEQKLARLKTDYRIFKTCHFVGRKKQLAESMVALTGESCSGVWISGMGGMGKTTLASEVCYRLVTNNRFDVCRIDMRNKTTLQNLVADLLSIKHKRIQDTDLTKQAIQCLREITQDTVVFLDNLDDILDGTNAPLFNQFLTDILSFLELRKGSSKKKLLLTARVSRFHQKDSDSPVVDIVLGRLSTGESLALLKWLCRKRKEVEVDDCGNLLDACGGCPLAIHFASNLLQFVKNAHHVSTYIPGGYVPGISPALSSSFRVLDESMQSKLIQLAVFKSSPFTIDAAATVLFRVLSKNVLRKTAEVILCLQLRSFLEVKDELIGKGETREHYSLHPLVFQFLTEHRKESDRYKKAFRLSQKRFVRHYIKKIDELGPNLEANYSEHYLLLDKDRVHIESLFQLLATHGMGIRTERIGRSLVSISGILFNSTQKQKVFSEIASRQRQGTNGRLQWLIQEANMCVHVNSYKMADQRLGVIQREISAMGQSRVSHFIWGDFYLVKGRLCRFRKEYNQALELLEQSLNCYEKCTPREVYFGPRATAANAIGAVYVTMGRLDEARRYQTQAVNILQENVRNGICPDIAVFLANIGSILLEKGKALKEVNDAGAEGYFKEALGYLLKAKKMDEEMNLNKQETYANKLSVSSKIEMALKNFDASIVDAKDALEIRKQILEQGNPNLVTAFFDVGVVYARMIRQFNEIGDKGSAKHYLGLAIAQFDEIEKSLRNGHLSTDHPQYENIKKFHEDIAKATNKSQYIRNIKRLYCELEDDNSSSSVASESSESDSGTSGQDSSSGAVDGSPSMSPIFVVHSEPSMDLVSSVLPEEHRITAERTGRKRKREELC